MFIGLGRALKPAALEGPSPARATPRSNRAQTPDELPQVAAPESQPVPRPQVAPHQRRRELATERWLKSILPLLHAPFMRLMQETDNLSVPPRRMKPVVAACTCNGRRRRKLSILVLRMTQVERIKLVACDCRPAAVQLVEIGLFPCAPYRPNLAVDINVLDFVRILFVNISPNVRAWCKASEEFLLSRNQKLNYSEVRVAGIAGVPGGGKGDVARVHETARLRSSARSATQGKGANASASAGGATLPKGANASTAAASATQPKGANASTSAASATQPKGANASTSAASATQPKGANASTSAASVFRDNAGVQVLLDPRPSSYLARRCPSCFGSGRRLSALLPQSPDCVVAIDACFSQKHNKQRRDPIFCYPDSSILDEEVIATTAQTVEAMQESGPTKSKHVRKARLDGPPAHAGPTLGEERGTAEPLRLPPDALAKCENSFKAAQASIAKASTGHHDVTAAMAIICRHDVPLFWANMTTAGEKRYYVVALMNALMAHLPGDWTVGLLYDIACQTHASALKWGLFDEYVERLMFAVSVFHAYGHEIGCQVLYHPRKRIGYGLSDGEGCERFWSSISKFISYLRVAGMQHIAATSLFEGAAWLARKRLLLEGKRKEANAWLSECGRFADDLPYLREQWRQQVLEQIKPATGTRKAAVRQEVEAALELKKLVKDTEQRVEDATAGCGPDRPSKGDSRSPAEKDADVAAAKANLRAALTKYERKVAQLGVDAKAKLERMRTNKALLCRAQCLILLRQARAAISKRKMELERVNAYHQTNKNG
ncbi:hypothetical protein EV121DRAFT_274803, partial [Schizophyllum commune]